MSFEALRDQLVELVRAHIYLAEPIAFALGLAEGLPVISLLIPSSILFLAIGGIHSAAGGDFWHVWLAAATGAVVGDCLTFMLGSWLRDDVERLRYFAVHPKALATAHNVFERWGVLAVFVGKFMGFARPFVPIVAGIVGMPAVFFVVASIVSSLAWAGAFLAPGYGIKLLID